MDRLTDPEETPAPCMRLGLKALYAAIAAMLVVAAFLWASDQITLQNERTIFTADCQGGTWQGAHCTGKMVAGPRYRFRALRPHGEVLFWTVGSTEPSGRLAPCVIVDGRNWSCPPCPEASRTITLEMAAGRPVPGSQDVPTKPFHPVAKWKWWALRGGIPLGATAEG